MGIWHYHDRIQSSEGLFYHSGQERRSDSLPHNRQEKQKEFRSEKTTLKEGEMWGGDVCDIESFVEEDGRINIKFIIFYLNM